MSLSGRTRLDPDNHPLNPMNGLHPSFSQKPLPTLESAASYQLGDQGNALFSAETSLNDEFRSNAGVVVGSMSPFWLFVKACCSEADNHNPHRPIREI